MYNNGMLNVNVLLFFLYSCSVYGRIDDNCIFKFNLNL